METHRVRRVFCSKHSKQCPIVLFTGSQVVSVDIMLTVIASHCPALKGSNFMALLSVGVLTTATCEVQDINEVNPVLWNYNAVDCVKLSLWQALEVWISGEKNWVFVRLRCHPRRLRKSCAIPGGAWWHHHRAKLFRGSWQTKLMTTADGNWHCTTPD